MYSTSSSESYVSRLLHTFPIHFLKSLLDINIIILHLNFIECTCPKLQIVHNSLTDSHYSIHRTVIPLGLKIWLIFPLIDPTIYQESFTDQFRIVNCFNDHYYYYEGRLFKILGHQFSKHSFIPKIFVIQFTSYVYQQCAFMRLHHELFTTNLKFNRLKTQTVSPRCFVYFSPSPPRIFEEMIDIFYRIHISHI